MRRYSLPLLILACVALAAALTWLVLTSAGLGARTDTAAAREAATERALPPFTRLEVSGMAEVVLVQGTSESVAVTAGGRRAGHADAQVRDGTLYIDAADSTRWWDHLLGRGGSRPAQFVVRFRDLSAIDLAGTVKLSAAALRASTLRISGAGGTEIRIDDLQARKLELEGNGALKAELAGSVAEQTIFISGAGDYRGARLASDAVSVSVSGAGKVVVHARVSLDASISGAGMVEYLGDPKVTEQVSGIGRVRRRNG